MRKWRIGAVMIAMATTASVLVIAPPAQAATFPSLPVASPGSTSGVIEVDWVTDDTTFGSIRATAIPAVASIPPYTGGFCTVNNTDDSRTITSGSCNISGLTPGKTFTVTVAAYSGSNASGTVQDAETATGSPVTAPGLPGVPEDVFAIAGDGRATVFWTEPEGPVNFYEVRYGSGGLWSAPLTSNTDERLVTGLTNGVSYVFQVRAVVNSTTFSDWSFPSAPVTPSSSAPGAPTGVSATASNQAATVSWTAPAIAPLNGYRIQYQAVLPGAPWEPASPLTSATTSRLVTGLTNGVEYRFRVQSVSGAQSSDWVVSSNTVIPPGGNPGAPTALTATPGNAQATVSWAAPSPGPSNGYFVQYRTNLPGSPWLPATPLTTSTISRVVTGLDNGTAYFFRVQSSNGGALASAWVETSTAVTPVGLPGTPANVVGLSGNGQVALTWTAPTTTAAAPVTGYKTQYSSNGGVSWTAGPTSTTTSATVTGLTNGTAYTFRVIATNGSGDGTASAPSAAVVPGTPAAPTLLTAQAGDRSAVLTWTILLGAAPTGYEVQYSTDNVTWLPSTPIPTGSTALTYTLTGLTNGTPYYLRVRAMNGSAASAWTQMTGTVTPVQPRSLAIIDYERNKDGFAVVIAESTGFAVGSAVNVRFRTLVNGKWSAWKLYGEAIVQKGGTLDVTIERTRALKVRFVKDGVNSETVTIARG